MIAADFKFNFAGSDYPAVVGREVTYDAGAYKITGGKIYVSAARA